MTNLLTIPVDLNNGSETTLGEIAPGNLILLVNTASECGLTPQYAGLQKLRDTYGDRGLAVIGAPCNQFNEQEPGSDQDIADFTKQEFGVTFPLLHKLEVNGEHAHPLYKELTQVEDTDGTAGEVEWNFEKFLIAPTGEVIARIRPKVEPEASEVVELIELNLPK